MDLSTLEILLAIASGYAVPQSIKILLMLFKHKQRISWRDLIVTGGMPSVHSAIVVTLSTSIWLTEGMSPLFLLSVAFAAIVIRDAMGVRRTAGEEGKAINELIRKSKAKIPQLHYALGHTPLEVTMGGILGLLIAFLVHAFF